MANVPTRLPAAPTTSPGPPVPTRVPEPTTAEVGNSFPNPTQRRVASAGNSFPNPTQPAAVMPGAGNAFPGPSQSGTLLPEAGPSFPDASRMPGLPNVGARFPNHPAPPAPTPAAKVPSRPAPSVPPSVAPTRTYPNHPATPVPDAPPANNVPSRDPVSLPQTRPTGKVPSRPQAARQAVSPAAKLPSRPTQTVANLRRLSIANPARGTRVLPLPLIDVGSPPWRRRLRMASFKRCPFYVEQQGRSSGRRVVTFEYPKRDMPYTEDFGRFAIRYQITGYLIQAPNWKPPPGSDVADGTYPAAANSPDNAPMASDYADARDMLEAALMSPGAGRLVDPYNPQLNVQGYYGQDILFFCERYSIVESRERGGFCTVEMSFVEAGIPGNTVVDYFSAAGVQQIMLRLLQNAADQLNQQQQTINNAPKPMTFQQYNDLMSGSQGPFQFQ
jgi:hypothetical protein